MAPKRLNESRSSEELSGRERKKQKTAIARTIAVQEAGPSNAGQNAAAGPSKSVRFDSKHSWLALGGGLKAGVLQV